VPTQGFTDSTGRVGFYDPTLSTTFATSSLWKTCPLLEYFFDPSIGFLWDWNGTNYDATATTGDWVGTAATSGSAAMSTTIPGALAIDSGATTDNQGFQIQALKVGVLPAANKSIWWEAFLNVTAATPPVTRLQFYCGLAASDTTIIAAGAQSTNNRMGHQILDGALLVTTFTADKAGVATTKTGPTLVAATNIRLGGFYDGVADTLQQYVNGAASQTAVATANIAKLIMYPSVVCQSDATDRPIVNLMAFRVFQLR
jgi:uncharacterized membrane protein